MFHFSKLPDNWNLYETEKKVPVMKLLSYPKSQETKEFTNNQKQGEELLIYFLLFHYLIAMECSQEYSKKRMKLFESTESTVDDFSFGKVRFI